MRIPESSVGLSRRLRLLRPAWECCLRIFSTEERPKRGARGLALGEAAELLAEAADLPPQFLQLVSVSFWETASEARRYGRVGAHERQAGRERSNREPGIPISRLEPLGGSPERGQEGGVDLRASEVSPPDAPARNTS